MLGKKFYKQNYDLKEYSKCAEWCNKNNATIEDKGDYYKCVPIPPKPLEEIKASKIAELKLARDNEELSPISYNGFMWDFDEKAQMRINGAIVALGENDTITWTSADNTEINGVNAEDLRNVVKASAVRSNVVHVKYRELRERVEQAETKEEVDAIVW